MEEQPRDDWLLSSKLNKQIYSLSTIQVRTLSPASTEPSICQAEFKTSEYLIHMKIKHLPESLNKIKMQDQKWKKEYKFSQISQGTKMNAVRREQKACKINLPMPS